jgi:hypothetical protein
MRLAEGKKRCGGERPCAWPTDEVWIHRRCVVPAGGGTCSVVRRGCDPDLHRIGTAWVVFVGCVERSGTHQPTTILFRSPIYPFYPFTHFGVGRPSVCPTDEVWIHRRCFVRSGGGTCSVVRRGCDPGLLGGVRVVVTPGTQPRPTRWVHVFVGCVERRGTHQPTTILFRSPIYPFYPFTHFGVGRPSVCPTDEVWIHRRCFVRSGGGTCNVVRRGCNPDLHRIGTAWVVFVGCVERSETHQPTLGCVTARWGFFTVVPMRFGLRPARILRFFRLSPFAFRLSPFAFSIYPFTHLPIYPFTR